MTKILKVILTLTTVLMFTACGPNDGLTKKQRDLFTENQVQLLLDINNGKKLQVDYVQYLLITSYIDQWMNDINLNTEGFTSDEFVDFLYYNGMPQFFIKTVSFKDGRRFIVLEDNIVETTGLSDGEKIDKVPDVQFQKLWSEFKNNYTKKDPEPTIEEMQDAVLDAYFDAINKSLNRLDHVF